MPYQPGEIEGVEIRQLQRFEDERGWLAEVFRSDQVARDAAPAMAYVSVTRPGVQRGPHEHRFQTDRFCFLGPGMFEVYLWDNRPGSATYQRDLTVVAGETAPKTIVVPPGVVHGYKNISASAALVINLPNKLYRGKGRSESVDEIRYESKSTGPFWIP